jgi:hypothetical protein
MWDVTNLHKHFVTQDGLVSAASLRAGAIFKLICVEKNSCTLVLFILFALLNSKIASSGDEYGR